MKCPLCKGKGEIVETQSRAKKIRLRKQAALALHKKGYSYSEIALLLGWKSPQGAQQAVKALRNL